MIDQAVSLATDLKAPVSTESIVPLVRSFNQAYSVGARDALSELKLFGFFHNDCVVESAAALVSLHLTKAGAYRAMNRRQWLAWEELQECQRIWGRRLMGGRGTKAYVGELSYVEAIEAKP
ncbi:hypothetical protein D3C72_993680 [compost metagenome]